MRTLTVTGRGAERVPPDTAEVRLAVVHRAPGMADALAGAESARVAVVAAAHRHVERAAVGSADLQVWPAHDHEGRPSGFEARHALTVRCADLEEAGTLVGAVAEAAGDRLQVEGVSLLVADPSAGEGVARERAFADARVRAEHLAALAGAELGAVQSVHEGGASATSSTDADAAYLSKSEVSFEPGTRTVSSAVTVTFELAAPG